MGEKEDPIKSFADELRELTTNSKPLINMLTILAEENRTHAPQLVQLIENHLKSASPDKKLPALYLMDSIIKNVGKVYGPLFSLNLVKNFRATFEVVDEETRELMFKLRQTWAEILPKKLLFVIDTSVGQVDEDWPVNRPGGTYEKNSGAKLGAKGAEEKPGRQTAKGDRLERLKAELLAKEKLLVEARIERCQQELKGLQNNDPAALAKMREMDKQIKMYERDISALHVMVHPEKLVVPSGPDLAEDDAEVAHGTGRDEEGSQLQPAVQQPASTSPPKDPRIRRVLEDVKSVPPVSIPVLAQPESPQPAPSSNIVRIRRKGTQELPKGIRIRPSPSKPESPKRPSPPSSRMPISPVPVDGGEKSRNVDSKMRGFQALPQPHRPAPVTVLPSDHVPPVQSNGQRKRKEFEKERQGAISGTEPPKKKILDTKKIDRKLLSKKDRVALPRIPRVSQGQGAVRVERDTVTIKAGGPPPPISAVSAFGAARPKSQVPQLEKSKEVEALQPPPPLPKEILDMVAAGDREAQGRAVPGPTSIKEKPVTVASAQGVELAKPDSSNPGDVDMRARGPSGGVPVSLSGPVFVPVPVSSSGSGLSPAASVSAGSVVTASGAGGVTQKRSAEGGAGGGAGTGNVVDVDSGPGLPAKRSKEEVLDELFGSEDVDYRQLPPAALLAPAPLPVPMAMNVVGPAPLGMGLVGVPSPLPWHPPPNPNQGPPGLWRHQYRPGGVPEFRPHDVRMGVGSADSDRGRPFTAGGGRGPSRPRFLPPIDRPNLGLLDQRNMGRGGDRDYRGDRWERDRERDRDQDRDRDRDHPPRSGSGYRRDRDRDRPVIVDTRFTNNEELKKTKMRGAGSLTGAGDDADHVGFRAGPVASSSGPLVNIVAAEDQFSRGIISDKDYEGIVRKAVADVVSRKKGKKLLEAGVPAEGGGDDDDDEEDEDEDEKDGADLKPSAVAMRCMKCNGEGHMYRDCPKFPRTEMIKCSECGERGHLEAGCPIKMKTIAEAGKMYCEEKPKKLSIDGVLRDIRICGDNVVAFFGPDDPRDLFFRTEADGVVADGAGAAPSSASASDPALRPTRTVVVDDLVRVVTRIGGPETEFRLPDSPPHVVHRIKIAAPLRELVIDGVGHECFFGGDGVFVDVGGSRRRVLIHGPPPIVAVGDRRRTDVVVARIDMLVRDEDSPNTIARRHPQIIGVYVDGWDQRLRVRGQPVSFRFVNRLAAFLWNGAPYETRFEGDRTDAWTTVAMAGGGEPPVRVKFSRLPVGFVPGAVDLIGMQEVPFPAKAGGGGGDAASSSSSSASSSTGAAPSALPKPTADVLSSLFPPAGREAPSSSGGEAAPSENVQNLLAKLQMIGLLPPAKKGPTDGAAIAVPGKRRDSRRRDLVVDEEDEVDDGKPVVWDIDYLRKKRGAVVGSLHRGMQCTSCGIRFRPEVSDHYSSHLDWHFRQNKAEKERTKRAQSRQWYYEMADWLRYEQFDDAEEFVDEAAPADVEPKEEPSVPLSELGADGERKGEPVCAACFEPFRSVYDREIEEHVLRPAVRNDADARLFHPLCLEDHLKRRESASGDRDERGEKAESGAGVKDSDRDGDARKRLVSPSTTVAGTVDAGVGVVVVARTPTAERRQRDRGEDENEAVVVAISESGALKKAAEKEAAAAAAAAAAKVEAEQARERELEPEELVDEDADADGGAAGGWVVRCDGGDGDADEITEIPVPEVVHPVVTVFESDAEKEEDAAVVVGRGRGRGCDEEETGEGDEVVVAVDVSLSVATAPSASRGASPVRVSAVSASASAPGPGPGPAPAPPSLAVFLPMLAAVSDLPPPQTLAKSPSPSPAAATEHVDATHAERPPARGDVTVVVATVPVPETGTGSGSGSDESPPRAASATTTEPEPEQNQEPELHPAPEREPRAVVEDDDDIIMEEPPERHYDLVTIEDDSEEEQQQEKEEEEEEAKKKKKEEEEAGDVIETRVIYRNVVEQEPDAVMDKFDFPVDPSIVKQEPLDGDEITRLNSIIHAKFGVTTTEVGNGDDDDDDDITEVPFAEPLAETGAGAGVRAPAPAATVASEETSSTATTAAAAFLVSAASGTPRIRINLAGKAAAAAAASTSKPASPEPPPPGLINKELTVFPPVAKGREESSLCCVM